MYACIFVAADNSQKNNCINQFVYENCMSVSTQKYAVDAQWM